MPAWKVIHICCLPPPLQYLPFFVWRGKTHLPNRSIPMWAAFVKVCETCSSCSLSVCAGLVLGSNALFLGAADNTGKPQRWASVTLIAWEPGDFGDWKQIFGIRKGLRTKFNFNPNSEKVLFSFWFRGAGRYETWTGYQSQCLRVGQFLYRDQFHSWFLFLASNLEKR